MGLVLEVVVVVVVVVDGSSSNSSIGSSSRVVSCTGIRSDCSSSRSSGCVIIVFL